MIRSFPPVVGRKPRALILGTMPSPESLRQRRYYAFRGNQFWRLLGLQELPYPERLKALKARGIALWDVLASCEREGSADTAIKKERPNPVPAFLKRHKSVKRVLFNGQPARDLYRRHHGLPALPWLCLPSSSPRNAARPFSTKRRAWRRALTGIW